MCKGKALKPAKKGSIVNKTCFLARQNGCGSCCFVRMKKILIILGLSCLVACHGNENAENKPTDLDRTKNNDTSAIPKDSLSIMKRDSTDTTRR